MYASDFSQENPGWIRYRWRGVVAYLVVAVALGGTLVSSAVAGEEHETVPRTFDGSGEAFRDGGTQLGQGFRGLGLGVRDTFTGRPSGQHYREGAKIGTGFKDFGLGIAGGGRAVGRGFKRAFTGSAD